MANEQNLMPIQEVNSRRSREQHSKDSSKGGKASVEARRRKKTMKENLELLLSLPVQDKKMKKVLEFLGIEETEMTNDMAMQVAMLNQTFKGNVQAYKEIRDMVDGKPKEQIEVEGNIKTTNPFEALSTDEIRKAIEKMNNDPNNQ